jgi:hypothetical protein
VQQPCDICFSYGLRLFISWSIYEAFGYIPVICGPFLDVCVYQVRLKRYAIVQDFFIYGIAYFVWTTFGIGAKTITVCQMFRAAFLGA